MEKVVLVKGSAPFGKESVPLQKNLTAKVALTVDKKACVATPKINVSQHKIPVSKVVSVRN